MSRAGAVLAVMCTALLAAPPVPAAGVAAQTTQMLQTIQDDIFSRAKAFLDKHTYETDSFDELKRITDEAGGFVWAPWCGNPDCEQRIQDETKATIRLVPLDPPKVEATCVACPEAAKMRVPFAKAY